MRTPAYAADGVTLIGHIVEGHFEPIQTTSPAPTGDDLDDLLLDCARAFTTFPRLQHLLDGSLKPSDGKYPAALLEELTLWIEKGNLRDKQQVNDALAQYSNYLEKLIAFGVIDPRKWKLAWWNVSKLRWYFAVPGTKPLPTKNEILAEQKRTDEEYQRRSHESQAAHASGMREIERKMRIDDLVKMLAKMFWSYDGIDLGADEVPPRLKTNSWNRQTFRKFQREVVEQLVDAGKTDAEITEEMTQMSMLLQTTKSGAAWGSSVPEPLKQGETRHFVEPENFTTEFMRIYQENVGHEVTTCMCMDGRFAITVTKNDAQVATAPIAPTGDFNQKAGACAA